MSKPIHPAIAEHVMQENERLREALREVIACQAAHYGDGTGLHLAMITLADRLNGALSQQVESVEPAPAQDEWEAQQCLFVMSQIGSMDAEDISGDDVDLRFEDGDGRDTGCDVSIVEYAQRSANVIERLLAARPAQTEQQPIRMVRTKGSVCWEEVDAESFEFCQQDSDYECRQFYAAPVAQTELVEALAQILSARDLADAQNIAEAALARHAEESGHE